MYYAMDHCSRRDIRIADPEHYRRLNATVIHDRVTGVDARAHSLDLASGRKRAYDKLLLACGSLPRLLGVENEAATGVTDFTTMLHAETLMAEARTARNAVVLGGGLIGAEVAEVLRSLRVRTDYLVRGPVYYPAFCGGAQSDIIVRHFSEHGVTMCMDTEAAGFEVDAAGHVRGVVDSHCEHHAADLVVRAIGVEPNVGFLRGGDIELGRGVLVGPDLKTSAPDVWAAGDCAELKLPGRERSIVQALWYTAGSQGWVAGENMAGGAASYDVPTAYGAAMFMQLDFCSYDSAHAPARGQATEDSLTAPNGIDCLRVVHHDNRVVGASFLGRALTKEDLEHMVTNGMSLADALEAAGRVFGRKLGDRAPGNRLAEPARLSRRAPFWPFGPSKTWRN